MADVVHKDFKKRLKTDERSRPFQLNEATWKICNAQSVMKDSNSMNLWNQINTFLKNKKIHNLTPERCDRRVYPTVWRLQAQILKTPHPSVAAKG